MGAGKWSTELSQIPRPLWGASPPRKGTPRATEQIPLSPPRSCFCLRNSPIVLVWELEMARGKKKVIKLPCSLLSPRSPFVLQGGGVTETLLLRCTAALLQCASAERDKTVLNRRAFANSEWWDCFPPFLQCHLQGRRCLLAGGGRARLAGEAKITPKEVCPAFSMLQTSRVIYPNLELIVFKQTPN